MSSAAETRCDVSVVVPLYRTADTVEELCERIASLMAEQRWSYELILVNDGSPDDDVCSRLVGGHPGWRPAGPP